MPAPRRVVIAIGIALMFVVVAVAQAPTTTTVMIDYRPVTYSVPLFQKAVAFVQRDLDMRSLAARISPYGESSESKALALMHWTHEHVRPVPAGFPVVDDHPYNIFVRGYGTFDQAADAFANLAAYSGLTARFAFARGPTGEALYAFGLVLIDGRWRVFDVREDRAFRQPDGTLAATEDLRSDSSMTASLPPPQEAGGVDYPTLFRLLEGFEHRRVSDQMPLERLGRELQRFFGLAP